MIYFHLYYYIDCTTWNTNKQTPPTPTLALRVTLIASECRFLLLLVLRLAKSQATCGLAAGESLWWKRRDPVQAGR